MTLASSKKRPTTLTLAGGKTYPYGQARRSSTHRTHKQQASNGRSNFNSCNPPALVVSSMRHFFMAASIVLSLASQLAHTMQSYDNNHNSPVDQSFAPPQATVSAPRGKCRAVDTPFCDIEQYLTVQPFNNTLGHKTAEAALAELNKHAYLFEHKSCSKSKIQLFLCSLYFPVCVPEYHDPEKLILPCRETCMDALEACGPAFDANHLNWPEEWSCTKFRPFDENKVCVINNARGNQRDSQGYSTPPRNSTSPAKSNPSLPDDQENVQLSKQEIPSHYKAQSLDNETMCDPGLFDCKLKNPAKNVKGFCIEWTMVCDGKKDCVLDGIEDGLGLDELNCRERCLDDQLYCDGSCLSKADICNGKVDCSLGMDEQDCYVNTISVLQAIFCIIALILAISLLVKFFKSEDQRKTEVMPTITEVSGEKLQYSPHLSPNPSPHLIPCIPDDNITRILDESRDSETFEDAPAQSYPVYQEPAYSILTRSDYERLNIGGHSGASSVYTSYDTYFPAHICNYSKEPPAPPPTPMLASTPVPQIYSTGSIAKSADLYVNMNGLEVDMVDANRRMNLLD